jgi:hypothetical protein
MEIAEKERLLLIGKKGLICGLTLEILELVNDSRNSLEIKKKMTTILSELSAIAYYSDSKNYDLNAITDLAGNIFDLLRHYPAKVIEDVMPDYWKELIVRRIELFCNVANSIRFDFTKKGFKIVLPKIKNINLGIITNK